MHGNFRKRFGLDEMMVHVPMCSHKEIKKVLVVGDVSDEFKDELGKHECKDVTYCDELNIDKKYIIDLDFFSQIGASALTDKNIQVPTGGLSDVVPITYVPFRNGIFLSIAGAIAEKEGCEAMFIGVVEEDSSGYPDCREEFISSIEKSINLGTKDETNIQIKTPLIHLKKEDIVKEAIKQGVRLELTWSCYQNEDKACGVCDSCRLRLKGFKKAGVEDLIEYNEIGE